MEERMSIAQEAAIGFARQLHKEDQAEIIDFDSQVRILAPFTSDGAGAREGNPRDDANGSTSLYNAIYISLKELRKTKASSASDIRRQAIVLLSDGDDTSSLIEFDEVLDLAKRSETSIYAIGLRQGEIGAPGVQGSGVRAASALAGDGRQGVLPDRCAGAAEDLPGDLGRALEPVFGRLHLEQPEARRRVAPHSRADPAARPDRANQTGVLRPDGLIGDRRASVAPPRALRRCRHRVSRALRAARAARRAGPRRRCSPRASSRTPF